MTQWEKMKDSICISLNRPLTTADTADTICLVANDVCMAYVTLALSPVPVLIFHASQLNTFCLNLPTVFVMFIQDCARIHHTLLVNCASFSGNPNS